MKGPPVRDSHHFQSTGENGPTLLQGWQLLEKLARFGRKRIPEPVVHARGTGAEGTSESCGNFKDLTRASFLAAAGKKTSVNRPVSPVSNHNQNGSMAMGHTTSASSTAPVGQWAISRTGNFAQAGERYRNLSVTDRAHPVRNLSGDLQQVTDAAIRNGMIAHVYKADTEHGTGRPAGLRLAAWRRLERRRHPPYTRKIDKEGVR